VRVVLDSLGIHKAAAMYETFPAREARRILEKLDFHYTPKHGSLLKMAEIELSVYERTLPEFTPDDQKLAHEVQALTSERNNKRAAIDWRF